MWIVLNKNFFKCDIFPTYRLFPGQTGCTMQTCFVFKKNGYYIYKIDIHRDVLKKSVVCYKINLICPWVQTKIFLGGKNKIETL